jgi:phosphoglycerate dehydrogenase-like enzyme
VKGEGRRVKILVAIYSQFSSWNIPDRYIEQLRAAFPAHEFLHARTDEEAVELIRDADAAFASEVRPPHLAAARRLRWIHSPAVGVGGMLFPEMLAAPVTITNSRGVAAESIAEHVVAVVLAIFRKLPLAIRSQSAGHWVFDAIVSAPHIRILGDSRVLLVGLGAIGSAVAQRMTALGAKVAAIRRRVGAAAPPGVEVHGVQSLAAQLSLADVVVLTAPQTRETWGMIGRDELAAMRPDAIIVNVSRGKLIDEAALVEALAGGVVGGAALDVFEHEPLPSDSPLWNLPNVLITPHTSWFRPDHWAAMTALFEQNLRRFAAGEPLLNPVDKTAGY